MDSAEKCLASVKSSNMEDGGESTGENISLYDFSKDKESSDNEGVSSFEVEEKCCIGGFYDVKVFLVIMCLFAIAHGFSVNGINNVNLSMYERRFHLTSTETGLIVGFYDIISLFTLVIGGYFMTRMNQPKLLGFASICMSMGSLTMALPHFLTANYQAIDAPPDICYSGGNKTEEIYGYEEASLSNYLYVFLAGQALHGITGTLLFVVGIAFIDGSVSDKDSPTYITIFFSAAGIGPGIGYVMGGWLLETYVDFPQPPPPGLTSHSPAWVGAWWIGFLVTSALGILIALPLLTYPKVLPGTAARRKNNINQAHTSKTNAERGEQEVGKRIRDIPILLFMFVRNPAYVCHCILIASEAMAMAGISSFAAKFIANQFNMGIGYSAIIIGLVSAPCIFIGQILGGVIVRKFNMKVKGMMMLTISITVIGMALTSAYFTNCELNDIAGVNHPYYTDSGSSMAEGLIAECNADCKCGTSNYVPVCMNDLEYFSPCHAGCTADLDFKTKAYSNCSCGTLTNSTEMFETMSASHGRCDSECNKFYIFLPIFAASMFFNFMITVPSTTVILRVVHDSHRTFAMAVKQLIVRLFGATPGPLLFGAILDYNCLIWQDDGNGSCWIYDNQLMGRSVFFLTSACKLMSLVALVVAYKLYKPPPPAADQEQTSAVI